MSSLLASEQRRIGPRRSVSPILGTKTSSEADLLQRAFRQRKEGYIKKLEEQVKEFQTMEQNYRILQNENYQLREYILNLQSRLLENQSDFPPAPSQSNPSSKAPESALAASSSSRPKPREPQDSEQQLRRELQDQASNVSPLPLAPILDPPRQDQARNDGLSHLQAAAARAGELEDKRQHESPYGLGSEYPPKRPRDEEGATDSEMRNAP